MRVFSSFLTLCLTLASVAYAAEPRVPNKFESVSDQEQAVIEGLAKDIGGRIEQTRDAHPKAHGCVDNIDVKVLDGLDPKYYVGFFQKGKTYKAIARLSSGSDNPKVDDNAKGPQGFALKILLNEDDQKKVLPVFGEDTQFVDSSYYKSFDILTITSVKEFFVANAFEYLPFGQASAVTKAAVGAAVKVRAKSEQIAEIKKNLMTTMYFNPPGGPSRLHQAMLLAQLEAAQIFNVLEEAYFSWVPSLYGQEAVKYKIHPCDETRRYTEVDPSPLFLRERFKGDLRAGPTCYRVAVQFHKEGFPSVENAAGIWSEQESAYGDVVELNIPQKKEGEELIDDKVCEAMSFNPGHAPADHYPIGGAQRARIGGANFAGVYVTTHTKRNENVRKAEAEKAGK